MAINYDKKLNLRIRRDVKNFNAKRKYLFSKGVTPALLPPKASTKELRAGFTNRRELMDRLNELEAFSAGGKVYRSAGGTRGTEDLYKYIQTTGKKNKRRLEKRAIELGSAGNTKYPVMLNEAILNLNTKAKYLAQDVKMLSADQLRTYQKTNVTPEKQNIRTETFYKSFYKMMISEASQAGTDPDTLIELLKMFKQLSPEELLEAYRANPEFKNIVEYSNTPKGNKKSILDDEGLGNLISVLHDRMPEIIKDIREKGLK